jgi:hypothetical protein
MGVFKSTAASQLLIKLKKDKDKKSEKKSTPKTKVEEAAALRKKSIKKLIKGKIKSK